MDETILEFDDNRRLLDLCGGHDRHLAVLEARLGLTIARRGNVLSIMGADLDRQVAAAVLTHLYEGLRREPELEPADVEAAVALTLSSGSPEGAPKPVASAGGAGSGGDAGSGDGPAGAPEIEIRGRRRRVKPRTAGQKLYVEKLLKNELVFGVGPAGTGKTYLAVAVGVAMFLERKIDRIILSRPAVEAGERLGFLPGTEKEKIDPYLRPLYDAIHDLWPDARTEKLMDEGRLEVAPLAFMRGRTLSNAFVVLDEAQNATTMQMRMFLTRLGENSRMVVTGDPTQIDLPRSVPSGLKEALRVLRGVKGVSIVEMSADDVVRHPLVGRIVSAYQKWDADQDGDRQSGSAA